MSNEEIVLAAITAVEDRDVEKLFGLYHDEIEFHDASSLPYGGSFRGKQLLYETLVSSPEATWLGTWGPLQPTEAERRMDPRVIGGSGGEVAVAYTQRAVGPDGERWESSVVGLYEVRDGKFARAQMFHYDTAAIVSFLERCAAGSSKPAG